MGLARVASAGARVALGLTVRRPLDLGPALRTVEGNRLTDMENRLVVARGGGKAEMEWEFWVCRCKLVYIEW